MPFICLRCRSNAKFRKTSISSPFCSFLLFVKYGLSQTRSTLSFVYTRSDCHLTIITVLHWIKVDHVLWSDSWETVHWRIVFNERPIKVCAANSLVNPMENKSPLQKKLNRSSNENMLQTRRLCQCFKGTMTIKPYKQTKHNKYHANKT